MSAFFLFFCSLFLSNTFYTVKDLGVLPKHQSSRAFSVSDDGVVAGESTTNSLTQHACFWNTPLDCKQIDVFQSRQAVAISLAGENVFAGTYTNENSAMRGWILRNGSITDIGTLGGNFCAPYAVNSSGVVVGQSHNAQNENHAFVWSDGVMQDIFPDSDYSFASDVNEAGDVVGSVQNPDFSSSAFVFRANGKFELLGTLGGTHCTASGINDIGQVVGLSFLSTGYHRAFLWEKGMMRDIGTLSGDTTSFAFDLNNDGVVIGESVLLGAPARPFVWSKNTGMKSLQSLIVTQNVCLEMVTDINQKGEIVGFGTVGKSSQTHALLLQPISYPHFLHRLSTFLAK